MGSTKPAFALRASALAAALLVLVASPDLARSDKGALKEWASGPVRYLMSRNEARRAKQIESEAEQLEFIRQFWSRRDPDRTTAVNESRVIFWQRVAEANRSFRLPGKPGWKTDRGKIYILLGPPNDIETRDDFNTEIRTAGARGLLRWHYTGLQQAANRAVTIIAFVREADEDWHLSSDSRFSSPFFDVDRSLADQSTPTAITGLYDRIPWGGGNLSTAMDLGRLQEVPSENDIMRAVIDAEGFLSTYESAGTVHVISGIDGQRYAAVTVAVRHAELLPPWDGSALSLSGRFGITASLQRTGGGERVEIAEERFFAEPSPTAQDPWVRFQALHPLPPGAGGTWELSAVMLDRTGGGAATFRQMVTTAAADPAAPALSGPVLASRLERSTDVVLPGTQPFRIGEAIVVPRMTTKIRADEPFAIFLALEPPANAAVAVALDWNFERTPPGAAKPEPWGRAGHLDDGRGPRAWEIKPRSMPAGHYTLTFRATVDGAPPVVRSIAFEID